MGLPANSSDFDEKTNCRNEQEVTALAIYNESEVLEISDGRMKAAPEGFLHDGEVCGPPARREMPAGGAKL